jgi:hypothetical protein
MEPTRLMAPGSSFRDLSTEHQVASPEDAIDDLDAPAYTRALTPLREIERRQAIRAADRVDAGNRTFNQRFWATLASEAGGVPSRLDTAPLARWVSGILERQPHGSAPPRHEAAT